MNIRPITLALYLLAAPVALAQEVATTPEGLVAISSRGSDVRMVLHDLFTQAKKNFVLEVDDKRQLFLSLSGVEFDEALEIVCKTSNLVYEIQNGIYFLSRPKTKPMAKDPAPVAEKPKPLPKFSEADLLKKVTTRLPKTDFRAVMQEFAQQTGVPITVDASVPAYKLDAFLVDTSLKYAMDLISRAAKLQYRLEPGGLRIWKPDENRVTIINPDGNRQE